jgi:hypothetical protein
MVAADRRHHQDRVGFLLVQRAVGDVGDREILDHLAAFQRQVADLVGLVRWLVRSVGKRGRGDESRRECKHPCMREHECRLPS